MASSVDDIREERDEARARIDQDIHTLQKKIQRTANPQSYLEENFVPFIVGALGLGLLLATLFVRRRDNEPPMPPKGSRRS